MDKPQRILLIQLKRAGDVIVTTPVLAALKKKFPQTEIDFLVEKPFAPLLENNPHLRQVCVYDKTRMLDVWRQVRAQRYDWIFDFQSSPRSALVCLASGARVTAGYRVPFWGMAYKRNVRRPDGRLPVVEGKFTLVEPVAGELPGERARRVYLKDEERRWAQNALPSARPPVGLIPTHRHPVRRWHAASFVALGQRLRAKDHPVWWFWGPGEEAYTRAIAVQVPGSAMIPAASTGRKKTFELGLEPIFDSASTYLVPRK